MPEPPTPAQIQAALEQVESARKHRGGELTVRERVKGGIGKQQPGGMPVEGFAMDRWGVLVQMLQYQFFLFSGKPVGFLWIRWQDEEGENPD